MAHEHSQQQAPKPISLMILIEVLAGAVLLGLFLTHSGIHQWDDEYAMRHSNWVLEQFGLQESGEFSLNNSRGDWSITMLYGPLWELGLGVGTRYVFASLQDPLWVRHSLNVALYLYALFILYVLLRRVGLSRGTGMLGTAAVFGIIRLGGHSLMNTRDAPAAVIFTCVTVGLWVLLRKDEEQNAQRIRSLQTPILIGIVSILPFLVRVPLLMHAMVVAAVYLGMLALYWNTPRRKVIFQRGALIAAAMIVSVTALYPPAWHLTAWELLQTVLSLPAQDFHWDHFSLLGNTYESRNMPWWYAFFWLPIIVQPLALLAALAGALLLIFKPQPISRPLNLVLGSRVMKISFAHWLWVVVALSWFSFILVQANLYDAERQILFLYPNLLLLGVLGLSRLPEQWKVGLAVAVTAASLYAYVGWGRYAYIYTNPLLPISTSDLQGDYWGLCMPQAVNALSQVLPRGTVVQVSEPFVTAEMQAARITRAGSSTFVADYEYQLMEEWPADRGISHFGVITNWSYRSFVSGKVQNAIDRGEAKVLWSVRVPTGETVCSIVEFGA